MKFGIADITVFITYFYPQRIPSRHLGPEKLSNLLKSSPQCKFLPSEAAVLLSAPLCPDPSVSSSALNQTAILPAGLWVLAFSTRQLY